VSKWRSIVVGVDGSPGSRKALTWAAAEAAEHGADLTVLNVQISIVLGTHAAAAGGQCQRVRAVRAGSQPAHRR
jgi:nucleotide-binding universal stress UspA family protein